MVDPGKVRVMTKLASYEKREERRAQNAGNFFRGDYIGWELLKSFICGTLAFLVAAGLLIFSDFETLLQDIYQIDLLEHGKRILKIYCIYMSVFLVGTYIASAYRFSKARKSLRNYYKGLKMLGQKYTDQSEDV